MPFNTLLLHGFIHGTSAGDRAVRVIAHEQKSEKILVFRLDTEDRSIRTALGFPRNSGMCDFLFILSKEISGKNGTKEYQRTFCLVELKGKGIDHATEQIIDTYKHLSNMLKQDRSCSDFAKHIIWKAYICSNPHSPIHPDKSCINELSRIFRQRKHFDISHDGDQNFNSVLRA
jgi:hypothetical protein